MGKRKVTSSLLRWLKRSKYAFPCLVIAALLCLTAFKINGSSVGVYYSITHGSRAHDPDLVYGHPQSIRSDEFLGSTVITEYQSKTGYHQFSQGLGSGRDLALSPDDPIKDWVTFFRPQNWSFFVIPFEYAFAFRWWFSLALLIIAAYFFVLRILNGNKKLAIILGLAFGLSPFFLWWYRPYLIVPFAYVFLIMILGIRIIDQEKIRRIRSNTATNAIHIAALSYLLASFALYIYVPFLLPIAIVTAAFLAGYLLERRFSSRHLANKQCFKRLMILLVPLAIAGVAIAVFLSSHSQTIKAIADSEYPGHRVVSSNELPFSPVYPIFGSVLVPLLQSSARGAHYYTNQSEASNFILLLPFLIIPGVILQIAEYRKSKKINFIFLAIQVVAVIFLLRVSVPFGDSFYNLLFLNRVPNNRLLSGIGLVGFLQLIYLIKLLPKPKIKTNWRVILAVLYGVACFAALMLLAFHAKAHYPLFIRHWYTPFILVAAFAAIIIALLAKWRLLAACLLLGFTLISSFKVMPLYKGLGFLSNDSEIVKKIDSVSSPTDSWAVVDDFPFESVPLAAGRPLVNGHQIYTDLAFWRQLDKSGKFEKVYNRQAHALFISDTAEPGSFLSPAFAKKMNQNFELVKGNVFKVRFACSDFVYKNVDFVLTTHALNMKCLDPTGNVNYPKVTFYTYKVHAPN